jgi:hypothetical protein
VVGSTLLNNQAYLFQAYRCTSIGPINQQLGTVVLNNVAVVPKSGSDSIISTVSSTDGQLFLDSVGFLQADLSYGRINKTGTGFFAITNCNRDVDNDVINGVRINQADISLDTFVKYTPSNYTPATQSLRSHLQAIDVKLGEILTTLDDVLGVS